MEQVNQVETVTVHQFLPAGSQEFPRLHIFSYKRIIIDSDLKFF